MKPFLIALILLSFSTATAQNQVKINRQVIPTSQIQDFQVRYGIQIQAGDYWYDKYSGAWGFMGGPTVGFLLPGVNIGGQLPANASNGNTRVFINGRQLHRQDLMGLQQLLGYVQPGRYWVDGYGNAGYEGGPALVNLWQIARKQNQSSFYRNSYTGIGAGSSGGTSYVMGKDWSVIVD